MLFTYTDRREYICINSEILNMNTVAKRSEKPKVTLPKMPNSLKAEIVPVSESAEKKLTLKSYITININKIINCIFWQ